MKKICLLLASLFLIFLSSTGSVRDSLSLNISFAQEVTITSFPPSNYELPYPGLLPDNPLYILRVIRDKVVSFLISDSRKKAEFDLLQSDKRLNAGIYLFNSAKQNDKKIKLAISTISKAENYFGEAIPKTRDAIREKIELGDLIDKLNNSSRKHQQVLRDLKEKAPANVKANFAALEKRMALFDIEVKSLVLKK